MKPNERSALAFKKRIQRRGLTIYDVIKVGDPEYWIPSLELQILLMRTLVGTSVRGLPNRTRSKVVKSLVCEALGYPIPKSFKKTRPRFFGQCFDTYVQQSNNLQIWNEDISPLRRYVLIQVSDDHVISTVRVIDGAALSKLDTTGTLTQKYQARVGVIKGPKELFSSQDSDALQKLITSGASLKATDLPIDNPSVGKLMTIAQIYNRLSALVGVSFADPGYNQERNRGTHLHRLVCDKLGYKEYKDDGCFPDVKHQLLEVKLQTAPTIDLGLVAPDSKESLDTPIIKDTQIRHCDVRYAIFCATTENSEVKLNSLILTTGEDFFKRFVRCEGKIVNKKLQIPLPASFFDIQSK